MSGLWLRAEIKTIALGLALVGLIAFVTVYWGYAPQRATNAGFGPEWECTTAMKGGPVCVKKAGAK